MKVDSEILRIEKRIRGLNRVTSAINDLSIYGIFYGNYPELVKVLEHAKDHVKAELKLSKKRLEDLSYPKETEAEKDIAFIQEGIDMLNKTESEADKITDMYTKKGI
tara:strand:+ start:864 stop:1184 length:321 start_codon:yes stop_codon:yes gene_type:complete